MKNVAQRIAAVRKNIISAELKYDRGPGTVALLAVSKSQDCGAIREAFACGQSAFGENYLQEALEKMPGLADLDLEWHFIGPVQANKTRPIATHFAWVHTVDRDKIACRLNDARPPGVPPLNVCIQLNSSGESSKSGIPAAGLEALARSIAALPRLRLRGLMTLPAPGGDLARQRAAFAGMNDHLQRLRAAGLAMDTLSMGTSTDMEAAIAEGATLVRVGTAIFGPRG